MLAPLQLQLLLLQDGGYLLDFQVFDILDAVHENDCELDGYEQHTALFEAVEHQKIQNFVEVVEFHRG